MNDKDTQDSQEKRIGKWGPRQEPNLDPNRQWAALRRRYEWKDAYDDVIAPKDLELEKELFGEENHVPTGINFSKYAKIKVSVKPEGKIKPIASFEEANLHDVMKENVILARYTVPTPVQGYSIPIITDGHDLMACAQTGSGKTAAFLIPTLSKLFGKAKKLAAPRPTGARKFKAEPLVLIIAPTRELATQIFDECRRFTYRSMLRPCVVYGGAEVAPQKNELAKGCDILTATPGRLNDFLDRQIVSLRRVKYLVLDEADRMLDMGFEKDIRTIVEKSDLCDDRQTLMFSATFPRKIRDLAKDFLAENYLFLTVGRVGGTTSDITQKVMYVEDHNKRNSLVELLLKQPPSRTLIFVETKRGADSLDDYLYNQNFPTTSIHGDRTQREREDALISFKNGKSPILIATAVAARGLDIKNVMHVINYDLCNDIDEYVHRIGRTARVGNKGLATTFYNQRNSEIAQELVKILMECGQEVPDFLQSYKPQDLHFDDDDDTGNKSTTSNYTKNTRDNSGYGNWDNSGSQKQAWDSGKAPWDGGKAPWDGGKVPWDNNNQAAGTNNNQAVTGWDNNNNQAAAGWDNNNHAASANNNQSADWSSGRENTTPAPVWDASKPSWETNLPQNQQPVQNASYTAPQQPPYQSQSFQQPYSQTSSAQDMAQYSQSKHNTKPSSQYPQVQHGGDSQPIVNLPRANNQYSTTPQTYGYNTQASPQAPSYGAGGYGGPPNNNNSQQAYHIANPQGNNDRYGDSSRNMSPSRTRSKSPNNQRNLRRQDETATNSPAPNSDSWDNVPTIQAQPNKAWNANDVPW